jgi:ParB-like chromosome segregation protein Spo0J
MSNLSHQQLAMFMPAHELYKLPMNDLPNYRSKEHLVEEKLGESIDNGLLHSVAKTGVQKPVEVYHDDSGQYLQNGHHRVVSAHTVNPKMLVPVEHHTDEDMTYQRSKAPLL